MVWKYRNQINFWCYGDKKRAHHKAHFFLVQRAFDRKIFLKIQKNTFFY